jgi:stage V sporulation protein D (sporulation-specific penicillin-binding protein)
MVARQQVRRRIFHVFILIVLCQAVLMGRLAWIQVVRGAELAERSFVVRSREVPVEPRRGAILDRMGRELAFSVDVDSVYAVPLEIPPESVPEVARKLAETLTLNYDEVRSRLERRQAFVWIERKVSSEEAARLREMDLPGIAFTPESQRFYPKGSLGAQFLGFAGIDGQGLAGIEYYYDRYLRGQPGKIVIEYDGRGRQLPQTEQRYHPSSPGYDLILTIDEYVQHVAEREAERARTQWQALRVTIIVMDPRTGAILAMASHPSYDPNHFRNYPDTAYRNPGVEFAQPPGSTFKPVTLAAALETGVVSWDDRFYCPGSIAVPGGRIRCWRSQGHGSIDLSEALENSCNVAFVQIGQRLGANRFFEFHRALGFGERTGVDLPAEARGLTVRQADLRPMDLAVMSFGQSLTVTPLQLVTAISAIANGGRLPVPHIARELVNPATGEVMATQAATRQGRQVLSADTARELVKSMEATVTRGTGRPAYREGYELAGKTGTAQKVIDGRVSEEHHIASFVGFGPASDPRVAAVVIVDEPVGSVWGSQVAAPVFRAVMEDVFRYLGIAPASTGERADLFTVPRMTGLTAGEAAGKLEGLGMVPVWRGDGPVVVDQVPPPGTRSLRGSEVLLKLGQLAALDLVTVPDVRGRTIREAGLVLGQAGLRLQADGTGIAVEQDPEPGVSVQPATPIRVEFRPRGR